MNLEQAKKDLEQLQTAVAGLQKLGIPVPDLTLKQVEQLTKQLAGNSSQQLADNFNTQFYNVWTGASEKNAAIREGFLKLIGEGNGLKFTKKDVEVNGVTITIPFAEGRSTGGSKPGTGAGTDRQSPKKGLWTIEVLEANPKFADYATKKASFGSANKVVELILNNGVNPFDLSAATGKGSNMVVTLNGKSGEPYAGGISARENFKTWFALTFEEGKAPEVAPEVKA